MADTKKPKFTRSKKKTKRKPGPKKGKAMKVGSAGVFEPEVVKMDPMMPDLFDATPGEARTKTIKTIKREMGGVDKLAHDINLLKIEWAIKFPLLTPRLFLLEKKGYSIKQADTILGTSGGAGEWRVERVKILDKMTETTVMRHIDVMAEVQETHIKASKVGLAKAVEMLAKFSIEPAKDKKGKMIMDGNGKPVFRGFRSIDLLNVMSAIEKSQAIYRKAMGLPNDEGGMAQLLERVQVNTQINIHPTEEVPKEKTDKEKAVDELSYDDIMEFIEFRREQKARLVAQEAEESK